MGRIDAQAARRFVPLAVVGSLLAVTALAASLATPGFHRVPRAQESQPPPSLPSTTRATPSLLRPAATGKESQSIIPAWLGTVAGIVCASLLVLLVGYLVARLVRHLAENRAHQLPDADPGDPPLPTRRAAVIAAVDAGLAELADESGDPRAAVIACWVRLEEVAAAAGTPREAGDTPSELVTRLLSAHQVSQGVLETLADLYLAARYGVGDIDAGMRTRARAALGQLRAELARSRSGPLEREAVLDPTYRDGTGGPRPAAPRHARAEEDR